MVVGDGQRETPEIKTSGPRLHQGTISRDQIVQGKILRTASEARGRVTTIRNHLTEKTSRGKVGAMGLRETDHPGLWTGTTGGTVRGGREA